MQELLSWKLLVIASILVAVAAELFIFATKTASRISEARQASSRGDSAVADGSLGPEMPEIPKTIATRKKLETGRALYRSEIRAERARGLRWFAIITAIAVWCTGILTKENALAP